MGTSRLIAVVALVKSRYRKLRQPRMGEANLPKPRFLSTSPFQFLQNPSYNSYSQLGSPELGQMW
jgi:hypothetical protein